MLLNPFRFGAGWAGPTFVSAGTLAYQSAGAGSISVPYPAGIQSGDLLVVLLTRNNNAIAFTVPGGWSQNGSSQTTTPNPSAALLFTTATGSESGSLSITTNTTSVYNAIMYCFRGATAFDSNIATTSTANSITDTTPAIPTLTTSASNVLALALLVCKAADRRSDGTDPTGEGGGDWKHADGQINGGSNSCAISLFYAQMAAAGTIDGNGSGVFAGSTASWSQRNMTFAIKP